MYLVLIDAHSKWLEVHIMPSTTSTATIEKLREIFATHGLPQTVVSDNGTNFTSAEFQQFMNHNGIKHVKVSPYHPASNGQADRAVRLFKEGIEKIEGGSLKTKLSRFLLKYRVTPHSTTGVPPAQLLMKRYVRTQLDLVRPSTNDRVTVIQGKHKLAHDNHTKERDLKVGDPVYVRDFRHAKTWIPGVITEKTCPVSAKIQLTNGNIGQRHQDHVRARTNPLQTQEDTYNEDTLMVPDPQNPEPDDQPDQAELPQPMPQPANRATTFYQEACCTQAPTGLYNLNIM